MGKLPEREAKGFSMGEATTYGSWMGDLKEGKPSDELKKYLGPDQGAAVRTTALGYYMINGTPEDIATVTAYEGDTAAVPVCDADADCKFACYVPKDPAKPDDKELKDLKTLGEFVKLCVVPEMKRREEEAKKKAPEKK
jgi:hypothetical protein